METITALKDAVLEYLRGAAMGDVRLVPEFPRDPRSFPLKHPVVAVGVESVELQDSGLGGYLGEQSDGGAALYGKSAVVCVYFAIHCPPADGGERCHRIYEALCDALLLRADPFGFYKMSCGRIGFDSQTASNRLEVSGLLRAAVTRQDTSLKISEFDVRSDLVYDDR